MDNGIYIALSRQVSLFHDMAVTANNIANVNTAGYQTENPLFEKFLVHDRTRERMAFTHDVATWRDTQEGPFQITGNDLDVALQGNGYFMIETPLGERYTRAGQFQVTADGTLVTPQGNPVLDDAGQRIQFDEDARQIVIGEAGNISVNGAEVAVLGIAQFDNPQLLEHLEGTMYRSDVRPLPPVEGSVRVVQGAVEGSNVKPVLQLTHMINVTRAVGSTAKLIEGMYDLERRTSNVLARQQG